MLFGLNISGSEFQKCKDFVLDQAVSNFVTIYVDDIIIISESLEDHFNHLIRVFERFRQYNVTINLKKSKFFQPEVKFLGYIVSTQRVL